ncbi:glycosyltransferase family 2 protein [Marinibactrum halimedae]|uniref:Glycosyltransferase 2-like domain-containing protein n=1 Tax=Marinibactrum halimedae TaxID=1444977 RepID=A0AA37WKA5_9GAMM|nr:glycosyltransferase family 2 protein [Marinibactrum halimedae]MCD9460688.1 glycosyltransferase [Marinibactrum halimedae]GLS24334.1 hypothetical protein GCM10007877_00450 [Marinibactrum halimedae]
MTHSTPIVSVVVPMYNVQKYIATCLESILGQTYRYFEVVCVNDGCTDNTVAIANSFKDDRIRIVHQRNQGLAAARNTGINHAKGLYIALLDSDDCWHPKKLELHVKHLHDNPRVGISYSASIFIDESGKKMGIGQFPKIKFIRARDIFCRNPIGNGSAAVIRRQTLDDVARMSLHGSSFCHEYFDEELRQSEDIELWIRIVLHTPWRIEGINKPLTYYRVNSQGLSSSLDKQLNSWEKAVEKNRPNNEEFFKRWYSLARAYQFRYLARRAIQSHDALKAISFIHRAIASDWKIIFEEPRRTTITYAAALISLLPKTLHELLLKQAMRYFGKHRIS